MFSPTVLSSLASSIEEIRERVILLHDLYYQEVMHLPTWDDLRDTELFYASSRKHIDWMSKLKKQRASLSSILLEFNHYRLEDLGVDSGYSLAASQKIKKDVQFFTKFIQDMKNVIQDMEQDLDYRIKFLSQAMYLLTSPYNINV